MLVMSLVSCYPRVGQVKLSLNGPFLEIIGQTSIYNLFMNNKQICCALSANLHVHLHVPTCNYFITETFQNNKCQVYM